MYEVLPTLAESTRVKHRTFLEGDVFPWIGAAPDLLSILRRIESRGANDIRRRTHNLIGRVSRFGVGRGLCTRDPRRDIELADVLAPVNARHHASITDPKDVGALLRAIDSYEGVLTMCCALRLAPYVFLRPGELRKRRMGRGRPRKGRMAHARCQDEDGSTAYPPAKPGL
jgi:integrase